MQSSLFFITKTFLQKEQYQINSDELKLQILSHPSYPSLHAVTGVLDHFGIENLALEVPQNAETLAQLPKVFIAHINTKDGEELVVVTQQKKKLQVIFENQQKKNVSPYDFLEMWDGIIVVIDKEEMDLPQKQPLDLSFASYFMGALVAVMVLFLFTHLQATFFQWTYFALSILGLMGSILIVRHDLGLRSDLVDKWCNASEKTSCDAVIHSKGAQLFGKIKWSDLSLVYFLGLTLASFLLLLAKINHPIGFAILTGLAMPIVVYTIYYQYFFIKKWCTLCLGLSAVLVLQFGSTFLLDFSTTSFYLGLEGNILIFLSCISVAVLWAILKPILEEKNKLKQGEIKHYKFKRNFTFFNAVYRLNPLLNTAIPQHQEITFGASHPSTEIVLVTSPLCFYCKKTHDLAEKIFKKYPNNIKVTIRFNVNTKDTNAPDYRICTRLLELFHNEGETNCQAALHDIYSDEANVETWFEKWGNCIEPTIYHPILRAEKEWCQQNELHFTPALLVNGRLFPKVYEREDLLFFIEDLIEQEETIQELQSV